MVVSGVGEISELFVDFGHDTVIAHEDTVFRIITLVQFVNMPSRQTVFKHAVTIFAVDGKVKDPEEMIDTADFCTDIFDICVKHLCQKVHGADGTVAETQNFQFGSDCMENAGEGCHRVGVVQNKGIGTESAEFFRPGGEHGNVPQSSAPAAGTDGIADRLINAVTFR